MKKFILWTELVLLYSGGMMAQQHTARPSAVQYAWHEQERIMFVCLDPCTWEGREYDNHSIPLSRINPSKLNTDQWCQVAKLWGAKEILFVAKHLGGFCWWQTMTSDYGVRNLGWKNGKGDVLKELSESCKKYGLRLGIYVSPADDAWGAGIGSGGRTSDPARQEGYNQVFRRQMTEVLSHYGDMIEVWFDGSCAIDVSNVLARYARHAVIMQGPEATIRWVGNENGIAPYPAWNGIKATDLKTGVSTAVQGDPDGDRWAPVECDVPLYDHYWFWAKKKEEKRISQDALMDIYYKSVGHGSVLLLNATPDTTGLIPEGDISCYTAFGQEINRRFSQPLAKLTARKGKLVEVDFPSPVIINHAVIMEDYLYGERIRAYEIEGLVNGRWQKLAAGSAVGHKKIDWFDNVVVTKVRLRVTQSMGPPLIRSFSLYKVDNTSGLLKNTSTSDTSWQYLTSWTSSMLQTGKTTMRLNLTPYILAPGQYELKFEQEGGVNKVEILQGKLLYEGEMALSQFLLLKGTTFHINRTAQVTNESSSILEVTFGADGGTDCSGGIYFRKHPTE
jgi:alpha-L-fucosidase